MVFDHNKIYKFVSRSIVSITIIQINYTWDVWDVGMYKALNWSTKLV